MDFSHSEYTLQAAPSASRNMLEGLRKVFNTDPGMNLQLILTVPVIAGGIVLHLNAVQWVLVIIATLLFLVAGVFRTAALLQINKDTTINPFQMSRIKCMGNAIVAVTAGVSLLTYMLVFIPKITQLL